jgi:hypothetical protein
MENVRTRNRAATISIGEWNNMSVPEKKSKFEVNEPLDL